MKARGKRVAKRSASPLVKDLNILLSPEKGVIRRCYFGLSGLDHAFYYLTRGDALRACPWLSYFAPLALLDLREVEEPDETDHETRQE